MTAYTVNQLEQAAWLVYINGLEIPVMSMHMSFAVGGIPNLVMDMVPHPLIRELGKEDRLQVVVFYLDTYWHADDPTFCLLGEFEVTGRSYNKTGASRTVQFQCRGHSQILEQLFFFFISSVDDVVQASGETTGGEASTVSVVKPLYPASLFLEGLISPSTVDSSGGTVTQQLDARIDAKDNQAYIKRPIDFVLNIFRALLWPVGTDEELDPSARKLPKEATSIPGKNFFGRWLDMTKYHRRWTALPVFEDNSDEHCFPLLRAAQDTQTFGALQQSLGQSVGNSGSAWQLIQQIFNYMYMEVLTLPAPPATIVEKGTGKIIGPYKGQYDGTTFAAINTYFVKPQAMFSLPPTCNMIFPSMYDSFSYSENFMLEPTRLYMNETFISEVINRGGSASNAQIIQEALTTGYPEVVRKRLWDLKDSPQVNSKNFLVFPEEFYKGPVTLRLGTPPWLYLLSQYTNGNDDSPKTGADLGAQLGTSSDRTKGLNVLFDLYTKCEYFKARFMPRTGGMSLCWNPYLIPGMSTVIFGSDPGEDLVAYIQSVSHMFDARGTMSTSISYVAGRSMAESLEVSHLDAQEGMTVQMPDIGPEEPIKEVSLNLQYADQAKGFYSRMLYNSERVHKEPVFDWKNSFVAKTAEGNVVTPIEEQWKLGEGVVAELNPRMNAYVKSRTEAMRYTARPVCTLRQYIEIYHNEKLETLEEKGVLKGRNTSFYSPLRDSLGTKGAHFWARIYKLKQGPGEAPSKEVTNVGDDLQPLEENVLKFVGVATGMPQTRKNWDEILEKYRRIIRSKEHDLNTINN
jgi:hypothetical protein